MSIRYYFRNLVVRSRISHGITDIEPDEIFLDASNLPSFDRHHMEGELGRPITKRSIALVGFSFLAIALLLLGKIWTLQVTQGEIYVEQSENNRLEHTPVIASRGVIYDRRGEKIAWNERVDDGTDFAKRVYIQGGGFGHLLGYVTSPLKDTAGFYYQESYQGKDGVERIFDIKLQGKNGLKIVETNALAAVESESVFEPPQSGDNLTLTIDAGLEQKLYGLIEERAHDSGFVGGAGIIMDVETGDILALTSYPEYSSQELSSGAATTVEAYNTDSRKPFLNRAVSGLYTPGSIIKPFIAAAALEEEIISPAKQILSTGALTIVNPFDPERSTIIHDWKAHGYVDLRHALAVSSNVYFFQIGGGFGAQRGLGISNIEKYARLFGFGAPTGFTLAPEPSGTIPNPTWKKEHFEEAWRLGDTYNTAIGQYGFQVTPLQAVRAIAAIANGGRLLTPSLTALDAVAYAELPFKAATFGIVREGMRLAVTDGTSKGLLMSDVSIASKTGTAELGTKKQYVNAWVVGFFPYEKPKYAFVVLMERGPVKNLIGSVFVMRRLFEWMVTERPYYLEGEEGPSPSTELAGTKY